MTDPMQIARRYFDAIEQGDEAALDALIDPDILLRELPNRLVPAGAVRDRNAMLEGFRRGKGIVSRQKYVIQSGVAQGDRIALEVAWSATLTVAVGSLKAGDTMRATFAVFLDLRGGRILHQRNYDCFEPF
jgi:ketosteroid isomerase-like protein